jgi:hypothetical protein
MIKEKEENISKRFIVTVLSIAAMSPVILFRI